MAQITSTVVDSNLNLGDKIEYRAEHLKRHTGPRLARRYRKALARIDAPDLCEAVADGYHKLLAYKDEYEVARLMLETRDKARAEFDGDLELTYHLAPPILSKIGPNGRPEKKSFSERWVPFFKLLSRAKILRGTPFDPFGRMAERKMERALIAQYERDLPEIISAPEAAREAAIALARLPLAIRGFGPVKEASEAEAAKRREELLSVIRAGGERAEAAQ